MPVDVTQPDEPTPGDAPPGDVPGGAPTTSLPDTSATQPFDPAAIIAQYLASQQQTTPHAVNPEVSSAESLYFRIWGVKPPHGYIESLVKQGLNVYEIAVHEMSKTAFGSTRMYRDAYSGRAEELAQLLGRR